MLFRISHTGYFDTGSYELEFEGDYQGLVEFIAPLEEHGYGSITATEPDERVAYCNGDLTEWGVIGRACESACDHFNPDSPNFGG